MTGQAFFVTGTDTGIGKTWVSAALAHQAIAAKQRVTYYKPIQTGTPLGEPPEDAEFVARQVPEVITACRYCFEPPVTPSIADGQGIIDFNQIAQDVADYRRQCDLLLVEGAGGLMAPISPETRMIDLIQRLALPVILVSHVRLGTLNHTLLSLEALAHRGIVPARLIFNFYPQDISLADIAVQTLEEAITPFLPPNLAVWGCLENRLDSLALLGTSVLQP